MTPTGRTGHTPGPWHWDSDPVKGDPYNRVRYQVCALGKTVTRVYYSSYEGGLTNAEADARLIAAAPELLDLAKQYAAECDTCDGTGIVTGEAALDEVEFHEDCPDCHEIHEVIAKATAPATTERGGR